MSTHAIRVSMWNKYIKGNMESEDCSSRQLATIYTTSVFSVMTFEKIQDHGVPCFLFMNTVYQISWLPGPACIYSYSIPSIEQTVYHWMYSAKIILINIRITAVWLLWECSEDAMKMQWATLSLRAHALCSKVSK